MGPRPPACLGPPTPKKGLGGPDEFSGSLRTSLRRAWPGWAGSKGPHRSGAGQHPPRPWPQTQSVCPHPARWLPWEAQHPDNGDHRLARTAGARQMPESWGAPPRGPGGPHSRHRLLETPHLSLCPQPQTLGPDMQHVVLSGQPVLQPRGPQMGLWSYVPAHDAVRPCTRFRRHGDAFDVT